MEFTKKELDFISLYALCVDPLVEEGKLFNIQFINNKLYFSQYGGESIFITTIDKNIEEKEECNFSIETLQFAQMMSYCKENDIIKISKDGIQFGESSKYTWIYKSPEKNPEDILNAFSNIKLFHTIKDLKKVHKIKSFINNKEDVLNCILVQDNFFTTFNSDVLAVINNDNQIEKPIYISNSLFNLIKILKLEEIELKCLEDESFFVIQLNNTTIFIENKGETFYQIPDIKSDDAKFLFNMSIKSSFNKADFVNGLKRIRIISKVINDSRLYITFLDNQIKMEIKYGQEGFEFVQGNIHSDMKNKKIILSSEMLDLILNEIESENFYMCISDDDEIKGVKFINEKENMFFFQVSLKDIQFSN